MSEETVEERQRRLARERQRRRRERQSSSEAAAARAADTLRRRVRLSQENEYEREIRKRNECLRKRLQRLRASHGEMLERRRTERERIAERREQLSQEEIEQRRRRERERIAFKRRNSSREDIEERRRIERERIAERRNNESDEAALVRRQKNAENMRRLRAAGIGTTANNVSATTVSSSSCVDSLAPPIAPKFQKKTGTRFVENQCFENREQKAMTHSVQPSLSPGTQMQVQHHLQVAAPLPASSQPSPRQVQMVAAPIQVEVTKPKPVEKPQPREKRLLAVANHQRGVMSSLASLWKRGKLCDAGIGNGSSTVKVHKLVLSAVCPKLVSVFNMDTMSHEFLQVNFPETVSTEALNAFAEYMYNGILDLDWDILEQLKIIAKRLDMEEFHKLCDSHLPNQKHQSASAAASFTNVPLIQKSMPIRAMTSSLASFGSTVSTPLLSTPSINSQVIDIKQEATAMFNQESEVASLAPNKSGNASSFVISPSIKMELVGPEDNNYGHWSGNGNDQTFTSSSSSSITTTATAVSVPAASTEFANPFLETTDVKSTRLKAPHSYEAPLVSDLSRVSDIVEMVHSQSSLINEDSSKPLDSLASVNLPMTSNSINEVFPIGLFTAKGDNLPLLTMHSCDAMTVNSFIQSEKT